jgi:hypothetical protein
VTIDGKALSDVKTAEGKVVPHEYGATCTWGEGNTVVSVTLDCKKCDATKEVSGADVTVSEKKENGETVYTASFVVDGETYEISNTASASDKGLGGVVIGVAAVVVIAAAAVVVVLKKKKADGTVETISLGDSENPLRSGNGGVFFIGDLPYGVYYIKEVALSESLKNEGYSVPAVGRFFKLIVNEQGVVQEDGTDSNGKPKYKPIGELKLS